MNCLLYRWKVFNQEDIAESLRNLGVNVIEYEEASVYIDEDKGLKFHNYAEVYNKIKGVDIVFSFNYFAHVSNICEELQIPYVSWSVDSPLISLFHESIYNKCNYIFIFDKFFYIQIKDLGLEHVYYLPLAVNAARLQETIKRKSKEEINAGLKSDVSFVGSMYHRNSFDAIAGKLPEELRDYFMEVLKEQLFIPGMELIDESLSPKILEELLEATSFVQSEGSFSDLALVFTNTFLGFKLANMERVVTINALASAIKDRYTMDLYTDNADDKLRGVRVKDFVDYKKTMPKVFNNSKINLNISLRNIRSGIPLRVWDVLGSGGFLLSNRQIEIRDYFIEGKEIECYSTIEEAVTKTLYYLEHDEERIKIAQNGLEKVEKEHSYDRRIEEILDIVKKEKQNKYM
ncbi:CgeB family protein [Lachnospira multipara]|uniref:CgeB family protein n=1 Tax=Lachnospira multipara TaxID=28051 RepID=UPI0004E10D74|nr:DUF3880 domain-containing protein [Lachnospira multipara]